MENVEQLHQEYKVYEENFDISAFLEGCYPPTDLKLNGTVLEYKIGETQRNIKLTDLFKKITAIHNQTPINCGPYGVF